MVPASRMRPEFEWGIRSPELDGIVPWLWAEGFRAGVILEKWSGWARRLPWNWVTFHRAIIQRLKLIV